MHLLAHRTIVFRLWLVLSLVTVVCTTIAFGFYVWLSIDDDIESAHQQTNAKISVVLAATLRLRADPMAEAPRVEGLGIHVDILDATGQLIGQYSFGSPIPVRPSIDPGLLAAVKAGAAVERTIRTDGTDLRTASISPLDVIKGGQFADEHIIPASSLAPGQPGFLRIIGDYPDLTLTARTLIYRSILTANLIIIALMLGMWLPIRHFVSEPLRRYSTLAMRIAVGEPVRMPTDGGSSELGELARAVNGMADALEHQATVDALTGLYNLRHLSSHLEALISEAKQNGYPLSVVFGDLDNLKAVNDTYGHEAGDAVLRAVSAAFREWAGKQYICWRMGGDEFVVAMPNTDPEKATLLAAYLRKLVASLLVPVADTHVRPSISVGVASFPEDGDSSGLLGIADRRMYASKTETNGEERLSSARVA